MAKIQITESELKQIIRESVEGVLNERNYFGMDWDQLSDDEKDKFTKRYSNWHTSLGQKADPEKVKQRYQKIQARKQKNGNASFSQEQVQRIQQDLQNKVNNLQGQVSNLTTTNNQLQSQVQTLTAEKDNLTKRLQSANAELQKERELNQSNLQTKMNPLMAQAQATTKTDNQSQLAAPKNTNPNPQTPTTPSIGRTLTPGTALAQR